MRIDFASGSGTISPAAARPSANLFREPRMKKLLLLVFLLAGAAVFWYVRHGSGPAAGSEYYADYLPADTLASVSLLDLQGLSEHFPQSALGMSLAKPVMHDIMTELGATALDLQKYDDLYDGLADLLTNPALQQIFGDDAAIALLPPDPARLKGNPAKELQNSLIAFGTSASASSIDSIARLTMSKDFAQENVGGLDMTRIRLDDNEVMYGCALDGVVMLAYDAGRITAAAQQKKSGGGLRGSPLFAMTKTFWAESAAEQQYAKSYLNLAKLRDLLAAAEQRELRAAAAYLQGFKSLGGTAALHQGDLRLATRAEYDLAALHEAIRRHYQARAEKNLSLALLTEKTPFYYWCSTLDPQSAKRLLSAAGTAQYEAADSAVRQELDLSIEQIMAAFGPQMGMTVGGIVNTGIFPLPKAVLFLQIQQLETARQVVGTLRAKIAERGFAQEQTDEVNGHSIYSWSLLPTEATHPALALTGNMLYFANGEASLKTVLAQEQGQLPQAMHEVLGAELAGQIAAANSSAFVLRPALLAAEAREAADWLAETFAASRDVSAKRLKEEVLRLMRSVEVAAGWGSLEQDYALSVLIFKPAAADSQEGK